MGSIGRPLWSICHSTARPDTTGGAWYTTGTPWLPHGWRASFQQWIMQSDRVQHIEYILCVDERWGFPRDWKPENDPRIKVVWNGGRKCCVDGFNAAAAVSTGQILILNSDDFFPPMHWDTELLKVLPPDCGEKVIEVSTGGGADAGRILTLPIMTRERYERLGYAAYPEYESMCLDMEFTEHARRDGVVIDARHLVFRHEHPSTEGSPIYGQPDGVYGWENRREAYATGERVFKERCAAGFPPWKGRQS